MLSAVSFGFAIAMCVSEQQLDSFETSAWKRIEPNIVRVMSGTRPVGSGVLIDNKGYFLAHRSVTGSPVLFGQLSSGETVQLSVTSVDEITQLALLHAEGWHAGSRVPAAVQSFEDPKVQKASASNAMRLVIVLPDRVIRGELTTSMLVGVMAPSRRGLTLSELRFEDPGAPVGGGLAFNTEGKLVGILGATLDASANQAVRDTAASKAVLPEAMNLGAGGGGNRGSFGRSNFGPANLTVGYSITPDILDRVITGFLSNSRQVAHPALGLFCRDAAGGGALIDSVVAGSVAQQAGLKAGDVLLEMGGEAITSQVGYTRVLVRQHVGETIQVKIRRGSETLTVPVRVGK